MAITSLRYPPPRRERLRELSFLVRAFFHFIVRSYSLRYLATSLGSPWKTTQKEQRG